MDYHIIDLPVDLALKDPLYLGFAMLSKAEACLHFDWFLAEMPARIKVLSKAVNTSSGYEQWKPDLTCESLNALGEWFKNVVTTRKRTEPEQELLTHLGPPILGRAGINDWDLSVETYSLCYDIGGYLAQVMLANSPDHNWKLVTRPKSSIDFNQPVLDRFDGDDFNPVHLLHVLGNSIVRGSANGSGLSKIYRIWLGLAV